MKDYNKTDKETQVKEPTIYSPEFIPLYPEVFKYGLGWLEAATYGFIRFYLARTPDTSFYFSNAQIARAIGKPSLSEKTVSQAISKLKNKRLIKVTYEVRAGGGKIRFIRLYQKVNSEFTKTLSQTLPKGKGNKNKEKENKIKDITSNGDKPQYGDKLINYLLNEVKNTLGKELPTRYGKDRHIAANIVKLLTRNGKNGPKEGREWLDDDTQKNIRSFLETVKEVIRIKRLDLNYLNTLYDWLKVYIAKRGRELYGVKSPWYARWLREREVEETRRRLEERAAARRGIGFGNKDLDAKFRHLLRKIGANGNGAEG